MSWSRRQSNLSLSVVVLSKLRKPICSHKDTLSYHNANRYNLNAPLSTLLRSSQWLASTRKEDHSGRTKMYPLLHSTLPWRDQFVLQQHHLSKNSQQCNSVLANRLETRIQFCRYSIHNLLRRRIRRKLRAI